MIDASAAPPVDGADLLFLVFRHLRRRGLNASAVALLRESGVDPFWLCGASRELSLLREWVFTGEFTRARSLLAPLQSQLPVDQFVALLGEIGKLQVLERAFADVADDESGVDRRELLHQLLVRARVGVETLKPTQEDEKSDEKLPFLRSCDAQECLDVILASTVPSQTSRERWDRYEARLRCFEALVHAFRDEIAPDEREHKYEVVAPEQLEWLVQDALLFHGQSDCIAVQTRAETSPVRSSRQGDSSDALYLSPLSTESPVAPREAKERRGVGRQTSVARSVDYLPAAPRLSAPFMTAAPPPLPMPTRVVPIDPEREWMRRKRHPLIASMDMRRLHSLREEEEVASPLVLHQFEEIESTPREQQKTSGVDVGTNTEPPSEDTVPTPVEAATTAHIDVEEVSTQTEAVEPASEVEEEDETPRGSALQQSQDAKPSKPPHFVWEKQQGTPPLLGTPPEANQVDNEDGYSPHQGSNDNDNDGVGGGDDEEQPSIDEGLDPHVDDDGEDDKDQPDSVPDDQPYLQLGYDQLALEHIVRARVVAEGKEAHAVRAMDVHRSGRQLVIGTNARALRLLDVCTAMSGSSATTPAAFAHHLPLLPVVSEWYKHQRAPIYCVAFSRETSSAPLVASGDADGSIKMLRLASPGQEAGSYFDKYAGNRAATGTDGVISWSGRHEGKLRSLRFSSGESGLLWSAASGDRSIRCWDVSRPSSSSSSLLAMDGHAGEIQALALAPPGSSYLASAASDRTLRVWDARSGRCEYLLASRLTHAALALEFHPRSANVVATGHQDGSVSLWDLRGATIASSAWDQPSRGSSAALVSVTRPHQDECRAVSWAPSGRWLLSGSFDGSVCFLSTAAALEPVASFRQHHDKVLQALWHPTAPAIVTSGADKRVKLWRFE